jgi:hypothetical protein
VLRDPRDFTDAFVVIGAACPDSGKRGHADNNVPRDTECSPPSVGVEKQRSAQIQFVRERQQEPPRYALDVNIAPVPQVRECDGFQKVNSAERADDVFAHNFPRRAGIDRIRDIQPIRGRGSSRILPRREVRDLGEQFPVRRRLAGIPSWLSEWENARRSFILDPYAIVNDEYEHRQQ